MRKLIWISIAVVLLAGLAVTLWVQITDTGRTAYNVVEYRLRRLLPDRAGSTPDGAITGKIMTTSGEPIPYAFALVATDRGIVYSDTVDAAGIYRITGVPAGRYVPIAAAWDYTTEPYHDGTPVTVRSNDITTGIDIQLSARSYHPELSDVTISTPAEVSATFPTSITAMRRHVEVEHAGLLHDEALIYEPPGTETLPGLLLTLPSPAIGWEAISVALANEGYVVVAVGPAEERGLDLEAHVRDVVAIGTLLFDGRLSERVDRERVGGLAGSFSSVLLFPAMRDLPPLRAAVTMGGISDGFLGYNALFREDLEIPPPYDSFVAGLGRPDRQPELYLNASPAFFAEHLPPTLIIHTHADRVIPVDQATRFANALEAAGTPHRLVLYEDVSHYLNPTNPTEETARVYTETVTFLNRWLRPDGEIDQ